MKKSAKHAGKSGYAAPAAPPKKVFARTRIAIVATRWNTDIVDALVDGAQRCLLTQGVGAKRTVLLHVPGAFEIPLALEWLARQGKVDGMVALGAVIRGDTPHFDFVANACTRGLQEVSLRHGLPIGFGVLTVDDVKQAKARAGRGRDNKGYEATAAVLEMIQLGQSLGQ